MKTRRWDHFIRGAGLAAAIAALTILIKEHDSIREIPLGSFARLRKEGADVSTCNPFALPGYVSFNASKPYDTAWIPLDDTCPPSPDYIGALRVLRDAREGAEQNPLSGKLDQWGRPLPDLDFLRNKLGLILGDSVDRNSLTHFADLLAVQTERISYENGTGPPTVFWNPLGTPYLMPLGMRGEHLGQRSFAGLNFGIANGFLYGLDDTDSHSISGDWRPPGLAEDRIARLIEPMITDLVDCSPHVGAMTPELCSLKRAPMDPELEQYPPFVWPKPANHTATNKPRPRQPRPSPHEFRIQESARLYPHRQGPAFISLHSGMWDMALFGRQDQMVGNRLVEGPLTPERMQWWRSRMIKLVRTVKVVFPHSPIWIRTIHRTGMNITRNDWGHPMPPGHTYFSDIRMHQLRQLQLEVAREEGVPIFDFWNVFEGYQDLQDMVHPKRDPAGHITSQAFLHHLYMESVGRHNWRARDRQGVASLPHRVHSI